MKEIPRYLPKMLEKRTKTQPGRIYHIDVYHDAWCDLLNNKGPCNCNPEVDDPVEVQ